MYVNNSNPIQLPTLNSIGDVNAMWGQILIIVGNLRLMYLGVDVDVDDANIVVYGVVLNFFYQTFSFLSSILSVTKMDELNERKKYH